MAHRTHTEEEMFDALALYIEFGPAEASRKTGIGRTTISTWAERLRLETPELAEALMFRRDPLQKAF